MNPSPRATSSEPVTLAVDAGDPQAPWVDRETGSRWSVAGRAVSGPRKGQTLRWLPGVMVKWYAWARHLSRNDAHDRRPVKAGDAPVSWSDRGEALFSDAMHAPTLRKEGADDGWFVLPRPPLAGRECAG